LRFALPTIPLPGGATPDGRTIKGTLHWVSAAHSLEAEVRLYDRLFLLEDPSEEKDGKTFRDYLNPDSLKVITTCRVEPTLAGAPPESRYQFERLGYFCVDRDSSKGKLVFNRTVSLRDTWAKIEKARPGSRIQDIRINGDGRSIPVDGGAPLTVQARSSAPFRYSDLRANLY
jgi:hypothetical protein